MSINKRTCIATGEKIHKSKLIRIVRYQDEITIDHNHDKPGRGCYIKNDVSLIDELQKRKLLHKAFKTVVEDSVYDLLITKLKEE